MYNTTIRPVAGVGSLVCLLWSVVTQGGFLFCVCCENVGALLGICGVCALRDISAHLGAFTHAIRI